jgi:signal transduction histidine kinase
MIITKKLKEEILEVYETYWDAYLNGDVKVFASMLEEKLQIFGSTRNEEFSSKTAAVKFYKTTSGQITGKTQFRNRKIRLMPVDNSIIITEQLDFFVLINKVWTLYGHGRISTLFSKKGRSWKLIHQHGSFPDSAASEGEQLNTDKIKAENIRLRDAVKRRTFELEEKNRELHVETALEKVRTVAMAMKEPADMLEICRAISMQLASLGVREIRNVQTAIFNEDGGTYMNYEYYSRHRKTIITETSYTNHKVHKAFAKKMLQGKGQFFITHIKGNKVRDWIAYQKTTNVFIDRFLEKASSLNYYWRSLGPVALGISTYAPLSKAELDLFSRFLNVFELAYTRYLDIEQTLAQVKEARIEASLEKVRTVAMSMRKPEDMLAVCRMISDQLVQFGVKGIRNIQTAIIDESRHEYTNYQYFTPYNKDVIEVLDYLTLPELKIFTKEILKSPNAFYNKTFEGKELKEWIAYRKKTKQLKDPKLEKATSAHYYFYSIGKGALGISTYMPLPHDYLSLFKRFRNVFELAYRRYLDIQKAEVQAREAQIEVALERVRSKAMAMHKSEDLNEAVAAVFHELDKLDPGTLRCGIGILNKNDLTAEVFTTSVTGEGSTIQISGKESMDTHPLLRGAYKAWLGHKNLSYHLKGNDLIEYYKVMQRGNIHLPESQLIHANKAEQEQYYFMAAFQSGGLFAFRDLPFPEETKNVMIRFAAVFNLTYTRFLDLQRAEAQTKEAQIELALERVRARTMAMQRSEELPDAANNLFLQVQSLGIPAWSAGYCIWDEDKQAVTAFMSSEGVIEEPFKLPITGDPSFINFYEAYKRGDKFYVEELGGEALVTHYQFMRTLPVVGEVLDKIIKAGFPLPTFQIFHVAYFTHGYLLFITYEPVPEAHNIFKRFTNVFEQTYTRFLDLQKAESQARESQIEAAVERVRAKALAMHRSQDLHSAVVALKTELMGLQIPGVTAATIYLQQDDGSIRVLNLSDARENSEEGEHLKLDHVFRIEDMDPDLWISKILHGTESYFVLEADEEDFARIIAWLSIRDKEGAAIVEKFIREKEIKKAWLPTVKLEKGKLNVDLVEPPTPEIRSILMKMGAGFDLAYRRFLDLQKAEAQAREGQIELGLERVRAKAMAMRSSEELKELIGTVFTELTRLDLVLARCLIMIYDPQSADSTWWMANSETPNDPIGLLVQNHDLPPYVAYVNAWRRKEIRWQYILEGRVKKDWDDYLFVETQLSRLPDAVIAGMKEPDRVYLNSSFNNFGNLTLATLEVLSNEHFDILLRFAKVFDLTYTRFNDLQKAEAQAREAQIEAALERVRSKAMAMHSSEDLAATIAVFYREMESLTFTPRRCGIGLLDKETRIAELSTMNSTSHGDSIEIIGNLKMVGHPVLEGVFESWLLQKEYRPVLRGNQIKEYYQLIRKHVAFPDYPSDVVQFGYFFFFEEGGVYAWTDKELAEDELKIYRRFTSVLSLTYKRYKDLKQAEAQAREAQIEAALERVRSRAMGMHKTDELLQAAELISKELSALGIASMNVSYAFVDDEEEYGSYYSLNPVDGRIAPFPFVFPHTETDVMRSILASWKKQELFNVIELDEEATLKHQTYIGTHIHSVFERNKLDVQFSIEKFLEISPKRAVIYSFNFTKGYLFHIGDMRLTHVQEELMLRFTKVFDMTYRRFLDLKNAEAQAREANIEASLERVRGKAMAMHSSEDLSQTVNVFFKELKTLGVVPIRCGVGEVDEIARTSTLTATTASKQGNSCELLGKIKLTGHPVLDNIFEHWKLQTDYFPELRGPELTSYYRTMRPHISFPEYTDENAQYGSYFYFTEGLVFAWTEKALTEEEVRIFRRFTSVISLTYRRYMELQKSEANAKEAVRQASLDRIRAEIASMRTVDDLDRITPLIWKELNILGIPFIRCGVFIMDNEAKLIHTFLSSPDGKAIGAFHLPYSSPGNISNVLSNWQKNKVYTEHWDKSAFAEFGKIMVLQGSLSSNDQYLNTIPEEGVCLHFVPFHQGMLYVGNTFSLNQHEMKLLQAVADAFSTAYARYEDFNKLEAAKKQVDNTLSDLKQAQQQLVQSEKMASLGELTAGIAHEIQNPLNFVNNFSDVSNELLEEMKSELDKGNPEEAIAIANDVKENLQKILHHGKRADAIVKGMLQHSRMGSGQKELTDINALADEYLRLSYHGLRAKDKSFNAKFETDFEEGIGKISVIPQDIGRVILNLINNAFYAVTERRKQVQNAPHEELSGQRYEPTVKVVTRKKIDKVEVCVMDNGSGIPQRVLEKIFQPFFTTKPTGQGTGLGLSLSYDIITKGHGGELKVETKEKEGSTFIISIPVYN